MQKFRKVHTQLNIGIHYQMVAFNATFAHAPVNCAHINGDYVMCADERRTAFRSIAMGGLADFVSTQSRKNRSIIFYPEHLFSLLERLAAI